MTNREHAILALFYEERIDAVTPTFLAYRLRMSTYEATETLDAMVAAGILDMDIDSEGGVCYTLLAGERERVGRLPRPQPASHARGRAANGAAPGVPTPSDASTDGTDGAVGWGDWTPDSAPHAPGGHHRYPHHGEAGPGPFGMDGSVGQPDRFVHDVRPDYQAPPGYPPHAPHAHGWPPPGPHAAPHGHPYPYPYPHGHAGPYGPAPHYDRARHATAPHPGAPYDHQPGWSHHPPHGAPMVPYQPPHQGLREVRSPASPVVAGFLSFLFVGAGQWYNGEFGKGIAMFVGTMVMWLFLLGWVVNIWSIVDAYRVAEARRALAP